jgi:hypothetical protein
MTQEPQLDSYLDALRRDLPSAADEARIRRQLMGAGLAASLTLTAKAAAAGSATVAKFGLISSLSLRFANLPLLSQFGLVVATTTAIATGPVVATMRLHEAPSVAESAKVATRQANSDPGALNFPKSAGPAAAPVEPATGTKPLITAQGYTSTLVAPKVVAPLEAAAPAQELAAASALAEETRLIDAALFAIRDGELSLATQLLDEHQAHFPQARLARERQRARKKLDEARIGSRP